MHAFRNLSNYLIIMLNKLQSLGLILLLAACNPEPKNTKTTDSFKHLWHDFDAKKEVLFQVAVEIPAGTQIKFEIDKESGILMAEQINADSIRTINYLPYPANYGIIPRTLSPKNSGGDGDPLDVFLLGPTRPSGSIQSGLVIGYIEMLDAGEEDDKILLADATGNFNKVAGIADLRNRYPGVLEIIETWLLNYKGNKAIEILQIHDRDEAIKKIEQAQNAYQKEFRQP